MQPGRGSWGENLDCRWDLDFLDLFKANLYFPNGKPTTLRIYREYVSEQFHIFWGSLSKSKYLAGGFNNFGWKKSGTTWKLLGNYEAIMKYGKKWNCNGINHAPAAQRGLPRHLSCNSPDQLPQSYTLPNTEYDTATSTRLDTIAINRHNSYTIIIFIEYSNIPWYLRTLLVTNQLRHPVGSTLSKSPCRSRSRSAFLPRGFRMPAEISQWKPWKWSATIWRSRLTTCWLIQIRSRHVRNGVGLVMVLKNIWIKPLVSSLIYLLVFNYLYI